MTSLTKSAFVRSISSACRRQPSEGGRRVETGASLQVLEQVWERKLLDCDSTFGGEKTF